MLPIQKLRKLPNPAWYTITVLFLFLSIFGIIVVCVIWCFANQLIYSYGIIIDAGSTSTKIHLYKWPEIAYRTNGEVTEVFKCRLSPGISNHMNDPSGAVSTIEYCIDNEISPKIPDRLKNKTFVYLGATAGMRLIEHRNRIAMTKIFESIEEYLLSTGYKMKGLLVDVKVISGNVEGIAAWITVNYLQGTLQNSKLSFKNKPKRTFGALDLGGASTQITFVPENVNNTLKQMPIRLYGENYSVYSHSYLCYGKSQSELRLLAALAKDWIANYPATKSSKVINNPCFQTGDSVSFLLEDIITVPCVSGQYAEDNFGYKIELPESLKTKSTNITYVGIGDPDRCHSLIKKLFNKAPCKYENCGFNNVYQPKISGRYIAFAGYNLVYKTLQNQSNVTITYDNFLSVSKSYCKKNAPSWAPILTYKELEIDNYRKWNCFGFLFVFELLAKLGFDRTNWNSIEFTDMVNNANLGWSLGYMINKTSMIPVEKPMFYLSFGAFIAILLICLVILFIGCLSAIISYKLYRFSKIVSRSSENLRLKSNQRDNHYKEVTNKV